MPTPAAAMSAVVPFAVGIDGSAPSSSSVRMSGTSQAFAASRNGVAPTRSSLLRLPRSSGDGVHAADTSVAAVTTAPRMPTALLPPRSIPGLYAAPHRKRVRRSRFGSWSLLESTAGGSSPNSTTEGTMSNPQRVVALSAALLVTGGAHVSAQDSGDAAAELSESRRVPAETLAAAYPDPSWRAPRTSWGDPLLAGQWSTDDFRRVPMNRSPAHGMRETLTDEEVLAPTPSDGEGRDFTIEVGTFLRHEYGIRTFGYTSLVIDPPDGRVPAATPAGQALAATRTRGTYGPGPFDDFDDFTLYERCITRGVLGSVLPVIYGNGLRIAQS